jgi:hypothetical protein
MVDQFSTLSSLKQNLVMQVPVECKLSTLALMIGLPDESHFINLSREPADRLAGSVIESSVTIGELAKNEDILELFTQKASRTEENKRFKKQGVKLDPNTQET